jgi:hypothetical protein
MRIDINSYNKELMRAAFGESDDTLHYFVLKGIEIPFKLATQPLVPGGLGWMDRGIVYLVRSHKGVHRGGHVGTLAHEAYHWAAEALCDQGEKGWDWAGTHHPVQEALFQKWKGSCAGFYAGERAEEMGAECFRVLQGFNSEEEWEKNTELLEDWKRFFMSSGLAPFFASA